MWDVVWVSELLELHVVAYPISEDVLVDVVSEHGGSGEYRGVC